MLHKFTFYVYMESEFGVNMFVLNTRAIALFPGSTSKQYHLGGGAWKQANRRAMILREGDITPH